MTTNLTLTSSVQRKDKDVAETEFENNVILLHIEHGKYYNFNETSSDLWHWLKEVTTGENLAKQLHQKYDCSVEQSETDVLNFLNELLRADLLINKS
ncbi:MAG TPA: PqqD family protein [Burkholderiales bacterium]|nr:PqqD family protein [Burkholderiales bacterium]